MKAVTRSLIFALTAGLLLLYPLASNATAADDILEMSMSDLEDKIRGGWAGQMVGVAYGYPWEFKCLGRICDEEISWDPESVRGSLNQDDLQVEMTFVETMDKYGLDATTEQYGEAFKNSDYMLWHANASARRNLQNGIKAPMSGHPKHNFHANDIDFQIEADFIGMMCPGMPQVGIEICDRVGHVMNYGDGVYGGMFVSGLYASAYFAKDVKKVVEAGAACMPKGSVYRNVIDDILEFHESEPEDWRACWKVITDKWDNNDPCPEGALLPFNIDAHLNGAFIAIGLLYGDADFGKTIEIATRLGQDADCNPSNCAGVLGIMNGFEALDKKWVGLIPEISDEKFVGTKYTFNEIVESTKKRALEAVRRSGGRVFDEGFTLPRQMPNPPALEQWSPGVPVKSIPHDDPAWTWGGDWTEEEGVAYAAPAGMVSHGPGNYVTLEFNGSAINIVGYASTNGGMADVYLDGEPAGKINAYVAAGTFDQDLWRAYDLEDGPHTVKIVTNVESHPEAIGTWAPVDGMGRDDNKAKRIPIHRAVIFKPKKD